MPEDILLSLISRSRTLFLSIPLPPMTRLCSFVAGGLILLLSVAPSSIQAQDWQQEIQIITPIQYGEPMYVFLDSLASALDRNPTMRVHRSNDDSTSMTYRALREDLYEEGVDLRSASHAFIRYRFDLNPQGSGVIETIEEIYFILRLDESRADLPILHVDTQNSNVSTLLVDRGIPSMVNMKSYTPFRQMLAYPVMNQRQETAVVELGRRALRDQEIAPQHEMLLGILNDHMSAGTYVLNTPHEQMASAGQ